MSGYSQIKYQREGAAIKGKQQPVFYLEIPPTLFGMVIKVLAGANLTTDAHVDVVTERGKVGTGALGELRLEFD